MRRGDCICCLESPNSLSHQVTPWPNEDEY